MDGGNHSSSFSMILLFFFLSIYIIYTSKKRGNPDGGGDFLSSIIFFSFYIYVCVERKKKKEDGNEIFGFFSLSVLSFKSVYEVRREANMKRRQEVDHLWKKTRFLISLFLYLWSLLFSICIFHNHHF
jgi:hypothetical protein